LKTIYGKPEIIFCVKPKNVKTLELCLLAVE
jgi:hypothetical protein